MLKTVRQEGAWFITQPDHAAVSGYLAAHWGNEQFTRPGYFAPCPDPERLRAEVVLAIAEHDNGWWEWEALPKLSEEDSTPVDITDSYVTPQEGMDRWRRGMHRLSDEHPYVALLISDHAYWLYAHLVESDVDAAFVDPPYGGRSPEKLSPDDLNTTRVFLTEIKQHQKVWIDRLRQDSATADWIRPDLLNPHVRLVQVLDCLSLSLCSKLIPAREGKARGLGEDVFDMFQVPRGAWEDRVTIYIEPQGSRTLAITPYPFDIAPLVVDVPIKIISDTPAAADQYASWWSRHPKQCIRFEYRSG